MKLGVYVAAAAVAALAPAAAWAGPILGNTSTAQLIGTLAANQAYTVTATGTVALCGTCNNSTALIFKPDGRVATTAFSPYDAFNAGPLDHDPSVAMGSSNYYGAYGPGIFLGALYGSFTATPTASDLFLIGFGTTIAASGSSRTLYGVVNDSYYPDNPASPTFNVTLNRVAAGAVPESSTWAMMLAGFGAVGFALRRRQATRVRVAFG